MVGLWVTIYQQHVPAARASISVRAAVATHAPASAIAMPLMKQAEANAMSILKTFEVASARGDFGDYTKDRHHDDTAINIKQRRATSTY